MPSKRLDNGLQNFIDNFANTWGESSPSAGEPQLGLHSADSLSSSVESEYTCFGSTYPRTVAVVRGLTIVLEHHNVPKSIINAMDIQVSQYLDDNLNNRLFCSENKDYQTGGFEINNLVDEGSWLQRCKYLLTYPLAKYLRNELPKAPSGFSFEPSGELRRWMRSRLCAFNRRNTHLWYSWFQTKRSTLPLSEAIVEDAYKKHFETLSSVDEGDDDTIDEIFKDPTFLHTLRCIRQELTGRYAEMKSFDEFSASTSACFEEKRSGGGQHEYLYGLCGLAQINIGLIKETELFHMRYDPVVFAKGKRLLNRVTEVRCYTGSDDWKRLIGMKYDLRARTGLLSATIQAVLEPNKIRIISKGEALPYYSNRPLQKALHASMRHYDCFRLIGRPFSPTDLIDLKDRAMPTDQWFSIDYSAATDKLSWKYSGRIFRFLIDDLPEYDKKLALQVLGPHALHYPCQDYYDDGKKKGKPYVAYKGDQSNGQLMGSILSFPILCLANLGTYLLCTQVAQDGWSHRDRLRHVLINGDDMIYAADPSLWSQHVEIAGLVGLEMSVGKAYQHREYCNINSVSVHYALHREDTPWRIDYLNAGLYVGLHKVQEKEKKCDGYQHTPSYDTGSPDDSQTPKFTDHYYSNYMNEEQMSNCYARAHLSQDPLNGLVANMNVLLDGSLPGRQCHLLRNFINDNSLKLRQECTAILKYKKSTSLFTRNLFTPLSVGGMGVVPPVGWKYQIKPVHRIVAASLMTSTAPRTTQRPLPGYELESLDTLQAVPWMKPRATEKFYEVDAVSIKSKASKRATRLGFIEYGPNARSVKI